MTHDIAHNLNIGLDFDEEREDSVRLCKKDKKPCTNIGGVMDYFQVSAHLEHYFDNLKQHFLNALTYFLFFFTSDFYISW